MESMLLRNNLTQDDVTQIWCQVITDDAGERVIDMVLGDGKCGYILASSAFLHMPDYPLAIDKYGLETIDMDEPSMIVLLKRNKGLS